MRSSVKERRHRDWMAVKHKKRIIISVFRDQSWFDDSFKNKEHMLCDAKVHCSCNLCAFHGTTRQERREYDRHSIDDNWENVLHKKNRQQRRINAFAHM